MKSLQNIVLITALTAVSTLIMAADTEFKFNIQAQELGAALQQLASKAGVSIFHTSESVAGRKAKALVGQYTTNDALKILLLGSGLTYSVSSDGSISVKVLPAPIVNKADPKVLPKVSVVAKPVTDVDSPTTYNYTHSSTATMTDTPLMETPVNIQIIPQQALKDQVAVTLDRALQNVSGVISNSWSGYGEESITIRGFQTSTVYVDGFRLIEYGGFGLRNLSNAQSVEVMKGDAAILYGANEPGGIVNIVTKQPEAISNYSAYQTVGSWNHTISNVDATSAINADKTLMYRFNANYESTDSWREVNHYQKTFIAPSFKWEISQKTRMTLKLEYTNNPYTNDNAQVLPYTNGQFTPAINKAENLLYPYPLTLTTNRERALFEWSHDFNDSWTLKHQLMTNFVSNIGNTGSPFGFSYDSNGNLLLTQSPYSSPISNDETDATRLILTGHEDTYGIKHTLLFGSDFYHVNNTGKIIQSTGFSTSTINVYNPINSVTPVSLDPNNYSGYGNSTNSLGIYAQDQLKFFDQLHVMPGVRYQHVNASSWSSSGPSQGGDGTHIWGVGLVDHAFTPRIGLLWETTDWLSLYSHYAGGFAANTGQDWQGNPLKSSSAIDEEVGAKTQFFDGRLKTSFAYFDLTKTNTPVCDPDPTHNPVGCSSSASYIQKTIGEVNSRGFEFDLQGEILPNWNMIMTYAYNNARVSKSTNTAANSTTFLVGQRMASTPFNTASFWTTYKFDDLGIKGWTLGGGVTLRDSSLDSSNTIKTAGYGVVNLMSSYQFKWDKTKITAQFNVNNLLDKEYINIANWASGAGAGSVGMVNVSYSDPRSFMGTLRVEF